MTNIRQKKGRYQIDFSFEGTRYRRETDLQGRTIATLDQAQDLRELAAAEILAGVFDSEKWKSRGRGALTVRETALDFLSERRDSLSPGTLRQYRSQFNKNILPAIGEKDIRSLSRRDMETFVSSLDLRDPSPAVIALKNLLAWSENRGIITSRPKFPPLGSQNRRARVITREMQIKILDEIPREHVPVFAWMVFQACRPAEATALKWKDLEGDVVRYRRTWSGGELIERTKSRSDRLNYIFSETFAFLPARRSPEDFIFLTSKDKPYDHNLLTRAFKSALKRVNEELTARGIDTIEISLYEATKHSTGTHLHRQGVNIETLRQHFGHTSINTTQIYVDQKPADEMRREIVKIGAAN